MLGGYTSTATGKLTTTNFAVARLNGADGSPDTNFGSGGRQTVPINGSDRASALALQPDGRIVLAGTSAADVAVARVEGDRVSLSLTLDDQQTTVNPGQVLTYALTVANGGPDDAVGTRVSMSASASFTGATFRHSVVSAGTGVIGATPADGTFADGLVDQILTIPANQTALMRVLVLSAVIGAVVTRPPTPRPGCRGPGGLRWRMSPAPGGSVRRGRPRMTWRGHRRRMP